MKRLKTNPRIVIAVVAAVGLVAAFGAYASDGSQSGPASGKPNIVMVLTDDQTYESLAKMPYTNGRSDWVRFDQTFVNNPLCCPSRATILTGQYAHHTGVQSNKEGWELRDSQTIATWLKGAGYRTAMFGKYFNDYPWDGNTKYSIPANGQKPANYVPPGWDDWAAFYHSPGYWNYTLNDNGSLRPAQNYNSTDGRYSTYVLGDKARNFIKSQQQPFFLQLSLYAPHLNSAPANDHKDDFSGTPVEHGGNHNEADVSDKPEWIRNLPTFSNSESAELDESRRQMWRTLLAVDEVVKQVFDTLEQQGELDNTMVMFVSDHGYVWGEHRLKHKRCVYDECARVPLLIRAPNQPGRTISKLVSNVDLAPTIADFAGVEPGIPVDGQSLLPLMRGETAGWRNELLLEWRNPNKTEPDVRPPSFWAIRTERYKYAELPETDETELYDLQTDPFELQNESGNPAFAAIKTDLAARLERLKTSPGATPSPPAGSPTPAPVVTVPPSATPNPTPVPEPPDPVDDPNNVDPTPAVSPSPSTSATPQPTEEDLEGRADDTPPPARAANGPIAAGGQFVESVNGVFKGLPKTGQAGLIGVAVAGLVAGAYYGLTAYARRKRRK